MTKEHRGTPTESSSTDANVAGDSNQAAAGSPDPDGMKRLWTPHRIAYIKGEGKPTGPAPEDGCPFCAVPKMDDADGLIIARDELMYVMMNKYPYNSGHIMILPYEHLADFTELSADHIAQLGTLTQIAMRTIRNVMGAHGFNIGLNQGSVAGAGIAAHLHQHIVPRWGGDANFMPVIAHTKTLPEMLHDTRDALAKAWGQ